MAISLKHLFNCAKSDGTDATAVKPSDWNAEHTLTALAGRVLGTPTGSTTVTELPITVDASGQSVILPSGTTANRPVSPSSGMVRYNTSTARLEYYTNGAWKNVDNMTVAASAPSSPIAGDLWIDTASGGALKQWTGSAWTTAVPDGSITTVKLATATQQSLVPAGVIMPYAAGGAPAGWLACGGQAISRSTYSTLFSIIGTYYGTGDGSTTFNLPDLRGRVVAGIDDMGSGSAGRISSIGGGLGSAGGAQTHTLSLAEMPAHSHTVAWLYQSPNGGSGDNASWLDGSGSLSSTSTVGSNAAHNNLQPTIALSYIIKT